MGSDAFRRLGLEDTGFDLSTRSAYAGNALANAGEGEVKPKPKPQPASPEAAPAPAPAKPTGESDASRKARAEAWHAYYAAAGEQRKRLMDTTVAALSAPSGVAAASQTSGATPSAANAAPNYSATPGGPPGGSSGGISGAGWGGAGAGNGGGYFGAQSPSDPSSDYSPYTVTEPRSPFEIKAGDKIFGTLETTINSDSPGTWVGYIGRPVLDYATHTHVLIPQGARIVGSYNSGGVQYGQDRLEVGLERVIFPGPCSESLDLGRMAGSDQSGQAGFEDETHNHYGKIFLNAILLAGISAGVQLSQPQQSTFGYPSSSQIAAGALGQQLGQLGMETARRGMSIPPTQVIRSGYPVTLIVQKDVPFEHPYSCPQSDGRPWDASPTPVPLTEAAYGR